MKLTFNGRTVTSQGQLKRELEKSVRDAVDRHVRAAAPPGVKVQKTSTGYLAEGDESEVKRMIKRLGGKA
jgi:hypothetical protein